MTMTLIRRTERRDHPRHAAHVLMEIRGPAQESEIAEIRGVTVDMSRGGALAVFADQAAARPGSTFMVRFVDRNDIVIAPEFRWGTVLRSYRVSSEYVVAFQFEHPLPPAVLGRLLLADLSPAKQAYA